MLDTISRRVFHGLGRCLTLAGHQRLVEATEREHGGSEPPAGTDAPSVTHLMIGCRVDRPRDRSAVRTRRSVTGSARRGGTLRRSCARTRPCFLVKSGGTASPIIARTLV